MSRLAVLILLLVLTSAALPSSARAQEAAGTPEVGTPTAEGIPGLLTFAVASADHVEGAVDYPQDPPAGGPHAEVWQNCGFYGEPVIKERAVHSQEHGAVWVTYRPDLPVDQVEALRRRAARNDFVLVSPYPGQREPVVASAWGAQVRLDGATDPRLRRFIRAYTGAGPEPGAPCSTGGTSETVPITATPAATPSAITSGVPVAKGEG